ncbi:thaumatin-like protein [Arachis duranensis]|uniref:Thaumatin-like protein n=1 Tax=Arachis duranensis TaxID=130453 RepID=A0A6P4CSA1_ARADU|nr:thaumatin-like protein [Arachis duranensis]
MLLKKVMARWLSSFSLFKLYPYLYIQLSSLYCSNYIHVCFGVTDGTQLILVNNCKENVWPGILGNAGQDSPKEGGFLLPSGEEAEIQVPSGWSGRIWGRQGCIFDDKTGRGSCETGDCAGLLQCKGIGGALPATLVEMTLGTSQNPLHFYDVSLVDGFNLPVSMRAVGGSGECGVAACEADLNGVCPVALVLERNGKVVGCKSACLGARTHRYCCSGEYANPDKCKPTLFARIFKAACPQAYSYAYDHSSALKTCKAPRYSITFCPPKP